MTEKQPTIKQWDMIAAKLVQQELAPKGFKVSKDKNYRGAKIADVHPAFLNNKKVAKVQALCAQMVKEYRSRVKDELTELKSAREQKLEQVQKHLCDCRFFQFRKKKQLLREVWHNQAMVGVLDIAISKLDYIEFK